MNKDYIELCDCLPVGKSKKEHYGHYIMRPTVSVNGKCIKCGHFVFIQKVRSFSSLQPKNEFKYPYKIRG